MLHLELALVNGDELLATLPDRYFDFKKLVDKHRSSDRANNEKLLGEIISLISRELSIPEWPAQIASRFLAMGCALARDAMIHTTSTPMENDVLKGLQDRADWLCSFAKFASQADIRPRAQACGVWIMSRLINEPLLEEPAEFISTSVTLLSPLGVPEDDLIDQVKTQIVLRSTRQNVSNKPPDIPIETARQWCQELLLRPQVRNLLFGAAKTLSVEIPTTPRQYEPKEVGSDASFDKSTEKRARENQAERKKPRIWPVPSVIPQGDLTQELQRCLIDLMACSNSPDSPVSGRTATQLSRLNPASSFKTAGPILSYAARDLWIAYSTHGDQTFLDLVNRVSLFLYNGAVFWGAEKWIFSSILHLWMNAQLPTLVRTCDLHDILEDAANLYAFANCTPSDLKLRQGIIEAHAGVCHNLDIEGDKDARESLLRDNAAQLRRIHEEYQQKAVGRPSEDEVNAWDYLSVGSEDLAPSSATTILMDPGFRDVIRRGSHEGTYDFVSVHMDDIRKVLSERLGARISPDHVMMPEGVIFNTRGEKRFQLDPRFVEGRERLANNDYPRASSIFERLADRLDGHPREIGRNFQAYALAKQDELLLARGLLRDLSRSRFKYPSAHWNLACCIPSEQMDQQLEALAIGLECSPHQRILNGAVYLALLLDDQRLQKWLPMLTLTEALLVLYQLQWEEMDNEARDAALIRIGLYTRHGEPTLPDPTDDRLSRGEVSNFINALLEGHQEDALEFWLRCREPIAYNRFDYWELRTDFLERTGRRADAVQAFRNELRCRLSFINRGRQINPAIINVTRNRSEQWLRQCMNPDLRSYGHNLFNMLTTFELQNRTQLLPRDKRIHIYYQGVETLAPHPLDINALLARVGATCQARLHEVLDLVHVSEQLSDLIAGLRAYGRQASANALERLLDEWKRSDKHTKKEDRKTALANAQSAYAEFQGNLQRDLNQEQWLLAAQLLKAFQRVNDRLARNLHLLPKLLVETLDNLPARIDAESDTTAFALRVRNTPGGATVRLKSASARLDDGQLEFPLKDRLDDVNVAVSQEQSAILTFQTVAGFSLDKPRTVSIELSYEFEGAEYQIAKPFEIPLESYSCPLLPTDSPYIYGRPLESYEIEGHFFGRDWEQGEILDSVQGGQKKIRYVEGIRRAGKSSLLNSIKHQITKRNLPLIPVYLSAASAGSHDQAGRILYNFLSTIAKDKEVLAASVEVPSEARCCANAPLSYSEFVEELSTKIPDRCVLALLDDFQELIATANTAAESNSSLSRGITGLLNVIWELAKPNSRLLWVFSGHRALRQYRSLLPGVLLWGTMKALPIDFLTEEAVGEILTEPLSGSNFIIPPETITRVHRHTGGYPEIVQEIAEGMLEKALEEKRPILTPADADEAAYDLANYSDKFAATWYPVAELSREQRALMAAFVNAVPSGGRVPPHRLDPGNQLTDALKAAIDDLVARKILEYGSDGTVGVKAHVLDLWLHRALPTMITEGLNGSVAIFIDVANLTGGTGVTTLSDLETAEGEGGIPGRFRLATVIDKIEAFSRSLSPAPIAARWVVNYPLRSPAVVECNAKGYQVENIPPDLFRKGSDDIVLIEKVSDVEQGYPTVNHFVLVLGDKDYRLTADRLLKNGKFVHIISRSAALGRSDLEHSYDSIARQYPERLTVTRLEELLERTERVATT